MTAAPSGTGSQTTLPPRRRSLRGLLAAEALSLTGSRMTFVALPWLVLVTTGSATRAGIVALAEMLPYVLANATGGPLVDRLGRRRTAIVMDIMSAAVVATIPLLVAADALNFTTLVTLVAVVGAVRGLSDTAKRVLFAQAVSQAGVDLTRATTLRDGISRAATLVGAPLAGLLIAVTDASNVLLLDAASFVVAALIIQLFVHVPASQVTTQSTQDSFVPYLTQLRQGAVFVGRDRLILGIIAVFFVTNLLDQAYVTIFVPVWAKDIFGSPVGIGLVSAVFAGGAVIGNIAYAALAPRLSRFAPFILGFLIGGAPRFVTLAVETPLWTVLLVAFLGGVGISTVNPILAAVMYERVPEHLQTRVLGLGTAVSWAGIPLGGLLGGWLVDTTNVRLALLVFGVAYLGATLLPIIDRGWRDMDRRPMSATSQAGPHQATT